MNENDVLDLSNHNNVLMENAHLCSNLVNKRRGWDAILNTIVEGARRISEKVCKCLSSKSLTACVYIFNLHERVRFGR